MTAEQYWVLLADPTDYGWPELQRDGHTLWDGVKNARAQNNLKRCAQGDLALLYHTSPDKAVMGVVRITRTAMPDPKAPERVVVEVAPVAPLARSLPIAELRQDEILKDMGFVRMPRVAVQAVTADQWARVLEVSGTKPSALRGK